MGRHGDLAQPAAGLAAAGERGTTVVLAGGVSAGDGLLGRLRRRRQLGQAEGEAPAASSQHAVTSHAVSCQARRAGSATSQRTQGAPHLSHPGREINPPVFDELGFAGAQLDGTVLRFSPASAATR